MRNCKAIVTLGIIGAILIVPAVGAIVVPAMLAATNNIDAARIAAVERQHPNFTVEQRVAAMAEIQSELHPQWKNLSWSARLERTALFVARLVQQQYAASTSVAAPFVGNQTVINNSSGGLIALLRQGNCSLSMYTGTYMLGTTPSVQYSTPTTNYEIILHNAAGLSTQANVFAKGCVDPTLGIGSRRGAYLGETAQGLYLLAGSGYDSPKSANALFSGTVNPNSTSVQSGYSADLSLPGISTTAAGDLNGDGLADVVGLSASSASIGVWLANANGTLGTPTFYTLTGAAAGTVTEAVVVADVNGDGKIDVVVATCNQASCTSSSGQEQIWVFTGKGDGTLNGAQPFMVPTPGNYSMHNLIAADLRATGHPDLVGSNGQVLLNSGTGTFTIGSSAFTPGIATSAYGPNLAAGDFNNDGKLDLAVGNGMTIQIYIGKGDATFTVGNTYASINDVGYLTATDLDGDGNTDLYVGLANGGAFGGDQFALHQAYAMMGNGDGSFQGAPSEPFTYNGSNAADLNADKKLDFVGVGAGGFTTYVGNGKGGFNAKATVAISPITIGGQQTAVTGGIDSYALGDINGDGIPDLAYIVAGFTVKNSTTLVDVPGVFIAIGDGKGGFAAPAFYPVASTLANPDFDTGWSISNLHLADLNRDGKADLTYNYVTSSHATGNNNFGTVVQLGNGDLTFRTPQVIPYYSTPTTPFPNLERTSNVQLIADLNKDGIPDLIFVAKSPTIDHTLSAYVSTIQVALGKGDGSFSTPTTVTGPAILVSAFNAAASAAVAVGDMNGDGIPDLIALGSNSSYNVQLAVALGNGDGTFKAPILTNYSAQYLSTAQGIAVGDFNGDGKLDVAISDPFTASNSGISLGNGDGTVQTIAQAGGLVAGGLPGQNIALTIHGPGLAVDLNGDGKADLLFGATLLLSQTANTGGSADTTTLAAAPNTVTVGQTVTLTATVASATGTPTGSVNFLDGTTVLGSGALTAQGTATFSSTALAAGTHSLTAQYSGDSMFAAGTSSVVSLVVTAAMPDFAIAASPGSGSVAAGTSATTALSLMPSGGFTGTVTVTLACSGLPAGAACSFSPASVAVNGAASTSTLTISTLAMAAQMLTSPPGHSLDPFLPTGTVLAGTVTPFIARRRRRQRARSGSALAWLGLLAICAGSLQGCHHGGSGGGSGHSRATPAGTYTVTVTATSGSTSHSLTYALTVT